MTTTTAVSAAPLRAPRFAVRGAHVLIGLIAVALAVRVVGLGLRPLWLDEAFSLSAIRHSWHDLWTVVPSYEVHPPFYYSLLKLWTSAFGEGRIALRSLSVLFSLLTIPVVVAAAFELEKQDASGRPLLRAGVAGVLASLSPMLIFLDQQARPYALMVLTYAVATLGLLRLMREFRSGEPGSLLSWALLIAGTELTLWSHSLGILYAFCLAIALVPAWLSRPLDAARLRRGILAALIIALLYLPCVLIVASQVGDWGTGWLAWEPFKLLELFCFYSVPVEALNIASAITALIMLLLLLKRGVQHAAAESGWRSGRAVLLLCFGPTFLAVLISALYIPVFLPRTLAATLVPAYLAISGALARSPSPRERLVFAAALSILLAPASVQTAIQPASEKWDEVAAYLQQTVGPRDEVWIYPNDSVLPLQDASPRATYRVRQVPADFPAVKFKGIIRSGSPAIPSLTSQQAERFAADPALRTVPTIWLVTRQYWIFDPDDDLPRSLLRTRRPGKVQKWGYIDVRPYYAR